MHSGGGEGEADHDFVHLSGRAISTYDTTCTFWQRVVPWGVGWAGGEGAISKYDINRCMKARGCVCVPRGGMGGWLEDEGAGAGA